MRSDFDPSKAGKGFLKEAGSIAAHALMSGFAFLPSRHVPKRDPDIHTLVFVHGLGGNRANFYPLQTYLWLQGYRRQYSFNYRTTGSIEKMAVELKRRVDTDVKGGRIDLICHSLGGLVARVYLQELGGGRRIDRFVTIGTPHHGSHAAAWAPSAMVRQLKPDGPFLRHLNSLPAPPVVATSIAAGQDVMVLPPHSALAPFGDGLMFDDLGHNQMLLSPAVFQAVNEAIGTREVQPPTGAIPAL